MPLWTDRQIAPQFASTPVANLPQLGASAGVLAPVLVCRRGGASTQTAFNLPGGVDLCVFGKTTTIMSFVIAWCASLDAMVHPRLSKSTEGIDSAICLNQYSSTAPTRFAWKRKASSAGTRSSGFVPCSFHLKNFTQFTNFVISSQLGSPGCSPDSFPSWRMSILSSIIVESDSYCSRYYVER